MKGIRILLGVGLSLATPVVPQGLACEACSCALQRSPRIARDASVAVFSGRVVALFNQLVRPLDTTPSGIERRDADVAYWFKAPKRLRVTIEVSEVWKGDVTANTEVYTASECCVCGFPFELGKEYLIYAYRGSSGQLAVSLCSRTRALSDAAEDIAALGPGAAPVAAGDSAARPPHN